MGEKIEFVSEYATAEEASKKLHEIKNTLDEIPAKAQREGTALTFIIDEDELRQKVLPKDKHEVELHYYLESEGFFNNTKLKKVIDDIQRTTLVEKSFIKAQSENPNRRYRERQFFRKFNSGNFKENENNTSNFIIELNNLIKQYNIDAKIVLGPKNTVYIGMPNQEYRKTIQVDGYEDKVFRLIGKNEMKETKISFIDYFSEGIKKS